MEQPLSVCACEVKGAQPRRSPGTASGVRGALGVGDGSGALWVTPSCLDQKEAAKRAALTTRSRTANSSPPSTSWSTLPAPTRRPWGNLVKSVSW